MSEKEEPCVEHHWDIPSGDHRCRYCQMKHSYWLDVKAAIDRGDTEAENWQCKPHYHNDFSGYHMELEEYFIFCGAVELLKDAKKDEVDKIMNEYHAIRSISWKLFLGFSIFGESCKHERTHLRGFASVNPKAKRFADSTIEDCYRIVRMYGVSEKQLEPFIKKASELREEQKLRTDLFRGFN